MSLNPKTAVNSRNKAIDAVTALLNSGFLDIYDGTQATDADTALGAQVKLAGLTFGSTAFGSAASASASANAITSDSDADATGTASWFRCYKSDHTTVVFDGSAGTSSANLVLNTTSIVIHATVSCSAFTVTMAA